MQRISLWSVKKPKLVIFILILITILLGLSAKNLIIDASTERMINLNDDAILAYDDAVRSFGSDNMTLLFIKDQELFTTNKLTILQKLHYELEDIKEVNKVRSIFNSLDIRYEKNELYSGPLVDEDIIDEEKIKQIKMHAINNPLIKNSLISKTGNAIVFNITINKSKKRNIDTEFTNKINKLISPLKSQFSEVFQIGVPSTKATIKNYILKDQKALIPISIIILLIIDIGFRSLNAAILPILTGGMSVIWTLGIMNLVGIPIQLLTVIVPTLILVVGATEDMHIISEYYDLLDEGKDKLSAINSLSKKISLPIMLTALTTFIGFSSIILNDLTMLKEFGASASIGLFINYFITISFFPVYLKLFGEEKYSRSNSSSIQEVFYNKISNKIINIVKNRKIFIITISIIMSILSLHQATKIKVDNDLLANFKVSSHIRTKNRIVRNELSGTQLFYITLTSEIKDAFKNPQYLKKIQLLQNHISNKYNIGSTHSIADYISLINREANEGNSQFYKVPNSKPLISQYLLMLSRDQTKQFITSNYKKANILVKHDLSSSHKLKTLTHSIEKFATKLLDKTDISYQITGESILINNASDEIAEGQIKSLSLLVFIIFIIMSFLFTNFKAGIMSIIPNIFPIIVILGVMGLFQIPLNTGTALIAAIAIGIAIDDTIHYMVRYSSELQKHNDQIVAMENTTKKELRPVLVTSLALSIGIFTLSASSFVPLIHFGILTSTVILIALLSDFFITPTILISTRLVTLWDLLTLKLEREIVENSELFRGMSKRQIKKIVLLAHTSELKQNENAITQGEDGDKMYLILKGHMKIVFNDNNGKNHEIKQLNSGEIFGELALVDRIKRSASVICTSHNVKLLEISWSSLKNIQKFAPYISATLFLNIARILGRRLIDHNEKLS